MLLPRRALTGSSIISKDRALGVGEALGRSLILDLGRGCRGCLVGSLGLSILLCHLGRRLCGGGAGVPLASHEREDAAGQKSVTPQTEISCTWVQAEFGVTLSWSPGGR